MQQSIARQQQDPNQTFFNRISITFSRRMMSIIVECCTKHPSCNNNNNKIPSVIPQVESGEECTQTLSLPSRDSDTVDNRHSSPLPPLPNLWAKWPSLSLGNRCTSRIISLSLTPFSFRMKVE